jgi:hypothetical protein
MALRLTEVFVGVLVIGMLWALATSKYTMCSWAKARNFWLYSALTFVAAVGYSILVMTH